MALDSFFLATQKIDKRFKTMNPYVHQKGSLPLFAVVGCYSYVANLRCAGM